MKKVVWIIGLLFMLFGCIPNDQADLLTLTFFSHEGELLGRAEYEMYESVGDIIFTDSQDLL